MNKTKKKKTFSTKSFHGNLSSFMNICAHWLATKEKTKKNSAIAWIHITVIVLRKKSVTSFGQNEPSYVFKKIKRLFFYIIHIHLVGWLVDLAKLISSMPFICQRSLCFFFILSQWRYACSLNCHGNIRRTYAYGYVWVWELTKLLFQCKNVECWSDWWWWRRW